MFSAIHTPGAAGLQSGGKGTSGMLSRLLTGAMTMPLPGCLGEQAELREYRGVGQTVSDSRRGQETRKRHSSLALVGYGLEGPMNVSGPQTTYTE